MSKPKKKIQLSSDVACDLVGKAFSDIIHNSKNESFKKQCYEILQVQNDAEVKRKIQHRFKKLLKKKADKKNDNSTNSVGIHPLVEDFEIANINIVQELDGFENWEEYINANK